MAIISQLLSTVGAAGNAVTLTIPAPGVANQRQRIAFLEIVAYTTLARTGGTTPVTVTSTNLNSMNWTFSTAAAVGTSEVRTMAPLVPMDGAAQNTAITIVCPATTSVMWRVNCVYRNEEA